VFLPGRGRPVAEATEAESSAAIRLSDLEPAPA
jgi:hypothetical protein